MALIDVSTPAHPSAVTIVDDDSLAFLGQWKWHVGSHGYVVRNVRIDGRKGKVRMHRLVMDAPPDRVVDHINRDRLDNTRSNLRVCSQAENAANAGKISRPCSSPFLGVSRKRGAIKWCAALKVHGAHVYREWFQSQLDAALAYDEAVRRFVNGPATTNRSLGLL